MAFKEVSDLETTNTITVGGFDKKANKPNPTKIEGYYIGTRGGIANKFNPDKPNCIHVLQTPKGNVGVWGKTNLDKKMGTVDVGCMIRISFTGTQPTKKGNDMLCYKVEVDTENTLSEDALPRAAAAQESEDTGPIATYGDDEESSVDDEDEAMDEVVVASPRRPSAPTAKAPDAARAAKVQALLNATRKSS